MAKHGGAHALVVGRQEAEQHHQQHGRVERVGLVVLGEHAALVDAVGADVGVDLLGRLAPALGDLGLPAQVGEAGAAVGGNPAHELRRREVLRLAPHLPHAAVGLPPVRQGGLDLALRGSPRCGRRRGRCVRVWMSIE